METYNGKMNEITFNGKKVHHMRRVELLKFFEWFYNYSEVSDQIDFFNGDLSCEDLS